MFEQAKCRQKVDYLITRISLLLAAAILIGAALADNAHSLDTDATADVTCSGVYVQGYNGFDAQILDGGTWAYRGIDLSGVPVPEYATVKCIEVEYLIIFSPEWNLVVELTDEDGTCIHRLWDHEGEGEGYILETESFTTCNGQFVKQKWWLRAKNDIGWGGGYIDEWTIKVYYGPPDNDDCPDAIPVTKAVPYEASTYNATGVDETSCGYEDTRDVWHSYTPDTTHPARISLAGSDFDTTLAVFASCAGAQLACNDNFGGTLQSQIEMDLTAETPYIIRVAGYNGAIGTYVLTVTNPCTLAPDFDHDCDVDLKDLREVALYWLQNQPSVNLAPLDNIIDFYDFAVLADQWGSYQP